MYKVLCLIVVAFFTICCGSDKPETTTNSTASPTPTTSPIAIEMGSTGTVDSPGMNNMLQQAKERDPEGNVLRQAIAIKDRLRYFGEELKTTNKPEKIKPLMQNVRETLVPATKEIKIVAATTVLNSNEDLGKFLDLCDKLDVALASYDPKKLPPILKDFNSTFDKLEKSLTKPKEH